MSKDSAPQTYKSVRFFPNWATTDGRQVSGLIQLMCDMGQNCQQPLRGIEIGTFYGESALIISSFPFIKLLVCVDQFEPGLQFSQKRLIHQKEKIKLIHGTSAKIAGKLPDGVFDFVYVDAAHDYDSVKDDLNLWSKKVKPGGFICGHDYWASGAAWPGVKSAVDEFIAQNRVKKFKNYCDSSYMMVKPL